MLALNCRQHRCLHVPMKRDKNNSSILTEAPALKKLSHCFSGWLSIALRQSDRGLICDINPENALFLHVALTNLRACDNRREFIEKMGKFAWDHECHPPRAIPMGVHFETNFNQEFPEPENSFAKGEIENEMRIETSWLYTDERYAHMRKLAMHDKIALMTEDIRAHATFFKIAQCLRANGIPVDTFYVSNISYNLTDTQSRKAFLITINHLLSGQSILIDATPIVLDQRCRPRSELSELQDWFFSNAQAPTKPQSQKQDAEPVENDNRHVF